MIDLNLDISCHADIFSVLPMQMMINPGGQSNVVIKFEPQYNVRLNKVESRLLMIVEPNGPSYEISLTAEILPNISILREISCFLSSREFLAWSGVAVGKSNEQTITFKNTLNQFLMLNMEVKGSEDFKFVMNYGQKQRTAKSKEIVVKGFEEFPVKISFAPSKVGGAKNRNSGRKAFDAKNRNSGRC